MGKQITPTEATTLCDNFDKKHEALCKITPDDNRSSLFTIEELENYINYLKESEKGIDGIRIYLGSYGEDMDKKSNKTTVFLAPTKKGEDNTTLNSFNFSSDRLKKYSK